VGTEFLPITHHIAVRMALLTSMKYGEIVGYLEQLHCKFRLDDYLKIYLAIKDQKIGPH
jgi:hypothetical protein